MATFRPYCRTYGGDRKLEIVNGKVFSANQIYMPRPRSPDPPPYPSRVSKTKKSPSTSSSSSSSIRSWSLDNPEMKRRKRVAKYKVYAVEGKVKESFRRGIRWIKNKCSQIVNGY